MIKIGEGKSDKNESSDGVDSCRTSGFVQGKE